MNKISKGNVVKFIDSEGVLNGGTVVELLQKDNEEYALINTLDDKKIRKKLSDLHPIKRQQRGRVSAKFMDELKEEIKQENANSSFKHTMTFCVASDLEPSGTKELNVPAVVEPNDEVADLKRLLEEKNMIILTKDAEIENNRCYIKDLENRLSTFNSANAAFTIKGLGDALLATSINKEGDMVQELLKIINRLNGVD